MVQKRPFYDEEMCSISYKHPRQMEHSDLLVSFSESVPAETASFAPSVQGETEHGIAENSVEAGERLASDLISRTPVRSEDEIKSFLPGKNFMSSWCDSTAGHEASCPEPPVPASVHLEYFHPERPTRTVPHCEDMYSLLLRYPPQKAVPIGSNHQADIPELELPNNNASASSGPETRSESAFVRGHKDDKRLVGTCVIPLPDLEPADEVGSTDTDCSCLDEGSVRCVKQHVMEAREKLKRILGEERFAELGFCDMGEEVAGSWSEEEEQLFREVVFSNPVSLGKNFWDHLSVVFPYRTKRDIVCYYFNVFMLRRRAEQNRCDMMKIDSDSDEWQGSDIYDGDESEMTDEDEDSVVESPLHEENYAHSLTENDSFHIYHEVDAMYDDEDEDENFAFSSGRNNTDFSETYSGMSLGNHNCNHISHPYQACRDVDVDKGVRDDIVPGTEISSRRTLVKAETTAQLPSSKGLNGGSGTEYTLEHCDSKIWDIGYLTWSKNKTDFLPTRSMIEEVFGDES